VLIEDPTDDGIFEEIALANSGRPEILQLLLANSRTPEDVRKLVSGSLHLPEKVSREVARPEKAEHAEEMRAHSLQQKIQRLTVSERIHLAMRGGREIRNILIKDTNKEVQMSVLENQKMTETEVEMIARSRSVPEEILRRITKNRDWMKNYGVVFALVTNPKTPAGIAVGLVSDLKAKFTIGKSGDTVLAIAEGCLQTIKHEVPKDGDIRYRFVSRFSPDSVKISASVVSSSPGEVCLFVPVVSASKEVVRKSGLQMVRIMKTGGVLAVNTDADRGYKEMPGRRVFNLVPGFECIPLAVVLPGSGKEVSVELTCHQVGKAC